MVVEVVGVGEGVEVEEVVGATQWLSQSLVMIGFIKGRSISSCPLVIGCTFVRLGIKGREILWKGGGDNKRMKVTDGVEFSRTLSVLASAVDQLEVQASQPKTPTVVAEGTGNSNNSALQRIETRQKTKVD